MVGSGSAGDGAEHNDPAPRDADQLIEEGWACECRGDFAEAEAPYRLALGVAPEYWKPHYMLGCLLPKLKRSAESEPHLWNAARRALDVAGVHHALGVQLFANGDIKTAVEAFEYALDLEPDNGILRRALGLGYTRLGVVEKAEAYFLEALKRDAEDYDAFKGLCELYVDARRYREIAEIAHRFIEKEPERREAWGFLAAAEQGLRHFQMARLICVQFGDLFDDWDYAKLILGQVLVQLNDQNGARAAFERALELNPSRAEAHCELGRLAFKDGKMSLAGRHYIDAVNASAECASAHSGIGFVFLRGQKIGEADRAFRRAQHCAPLLAEAQAGLGLVSLRSEDHFGALFRFARALSLDFSHSMSHVGIGDAYASIQALDQAERAYRIALDIDPFDVGALSRLADLLDKQGRTEEAREFRKRMMSFTRPGSMSRITDFDKGISELVGLLEEYLNLTE